MPAARKRATADFDVLHRLPTTDRGLHQRIDVLHAKTGAIDAECPQALRQMLRHISRIEFDGVFVTGFKDEAVTQNPHDGGEPFRAEDAWRSAAPMQPGDTERPR